MRRLAVLSAVAAGTAVAVSGSGALAASRTPARPLFGIVTRSDFSQQLVGLDPRTLRPLAVKLQLDGHVSGWSFSPEERALVLGDDNESCVGGATSLRLVDLARMRTLGDVPLVGNGPVEATTWADARHVLAAVAVGDCISTTRTAVLSVDARTRRVLAKTLLRGAVRGVASGPGRLVLLLGPRDRIGRARLAVVDARGRVRETTLNRISTGRTLPDAHSNGSISSVDVPGLAVDPARGRAFVVPAGGRVAEIDLTTLHVAYHTLARKESIWTRLRHWLDPSALGKGENGPTRQALWLGNGLLAVTGTDYALASARDGRTEISSTAAGLRLVDTRTWRYRNLDPGISSIELAGGLLLAHGSSYDGSTGKQTNAGLIVYSLDGDERYRLYAGRDVAAAAIGGHGYVSIATARGTTKTLAFALASGAIQRPVATSVWTLLFGRAAPFVS